MHLKRLRIINFRALENIDVTFDTPVSVLIGPNAIGKTTVLEAIRLAKGVLAARTQNETNQIFYTLGLMSPHLPGRLFPAAVTNKPEVPLSIKCMYELTQDEIAKVRSLGPQIVNNIAQQNAGLSFSSPAQAVAFFNSDVGRQAIASAARVLNEELGRLSGTPTVNLNLSIDFKTGNINGEYPMQQIMFALLDQVLPPTESMFSYFPADRAMPVGEQPVQLGVGDTSNQLESYNSQPQLKYQRLKNTIFNSIVNGTSGRSDLKKQFQLIFERILRGKELGDIGINDLGMLSIPIKDLESGAQFQIDGLSSGEKGLLLTFLLMAQNTASHGIVLLDEPELHLNPAVCRDLLQFLVDEYVEKRGTQAIICSHSAEILAGTFERSSCSLFHLRDGKTLAKVRYQDQGEIRDALRRLGSSESEALLFKGAISVEGIHDVEILQTGFSPLFRRYKLKDRGGRKQIEKDIAELQKAEINNDEVGFHYFIFDHDRKPTQLRESTHVKFLQWDRYCLENYLLDFEILTDLSRNKEFSSSPKQTVAAMEAVMKPLALNQLDRHIARVIFKDLGLENICFDMDVVDESNPSIVAAGLLSQIENMAANFDSLKSVGFEQEFTERFSEKLREQSPIWQEKWPELCDGKRLFKDLRSEGHFNGDPLKLKKAVISQMCTKDTATYRALNASLRLLISSNV